MVDVKLIRQEAEQKLQQLVDGRANRDAVSNWAEDIYYSLDNKKHIEESSSLSDLFDSLAMASMRHDKDGSFMYDEATLRYWLNEYNEEWTEEQSS